LLLPGLLILLWPRSWRPSIRDLVVPFSLGVILAGIVPLLAHQYRMTGVWYLPTYGAADTVPPSLDRLGANALYYLGGGRGGTYNWALFAVLLGVGGFLMYHPRLRGSRSHLGWTRLLVSALTLWVVPTAYFLTHPIAASYYTIPATFGTVLLVALGALTIEPRGSVAAWHTQPTRRGGLRRLALALALLPGLIAVIPPWLAYARGVAPVERPAQPVALPTELTAEQAWVWADLTSGTFWYYGNKPAFKIGYTIPEVRAAAFRLVFERREPQYLVRDSATMQEIMQEISRMGGELQPRGEVNGHPYFLIHWPRGGPVDVPVHGAAS
jgi:hypothetical protein